MRYKLRRGGRAVNDNARRRVGSGGRIRPGERAPDLFSGRIGFGNLEAGLL